MSGECDKKYLAKTFPGLYHLLCIPGVDFSKLFEENRGKALELLRKLYGEKASELLSKLLAEACFKED